MNFLSASARIPRRLSALTVGNLAINNGSALWDDRTTGTRKEISQINLALKDVSLERPFKLTFSALVDQKPLSIDGSVGPLGQGFQAATIPVDLSLKALKQLALQLKGSLENPLTNPGVNMDIEIAEFSPRELVAALGQQFPVKTSDPKALNSIALQTHVRADGAKVFNQRRHQSGSIQIEFLRDGFAIFTTKFEV